MSNKNDKYYKNRNNTSGINSLRGICVGNLFPTNETKYEPLDVYSLYNIQENKTKQTEEISVSSLIKQKKDKLQKVYDEYRKIYRMCLTRIKMANKISIYSIYYEIPIAVFRCPEYSQIECLDYISSKLKKLPQFEINIILPNILFINWSELKTS
jgi:hypothetical protein